MSNLQHVNSSIRSQSSVSRSSNTSVSSILRDSSAKKEKKQQSVRFEDSPVPDKTITIKLSEIYANLKSPSPEIRSPSHSYFNKAKNKCENCQKEPLAQTTRGSLASSSVRPSPVKAASVQQSNHEVLSVNDPRFGPKVINYTFRNQNFYEKLNRFYGKSEREDDKANRRVSHASEGGSERRSKAKSSAEAKAKFQEASVIQLKPCHREQVLKGKSPSPGRETKQTSQKRLKSTYGQNILN